MADNVIRIGEETPAGVVNTELVDLLGRLLERAKSGEIVGLAYAATDGGDAIAHGWESGGHNLLISSSVAVLNYTFQQALAE